jgi:DNA-binding MarR family transcriptional regulator
MEITYFRSRRPGPEIAIENVVASQVSDLLDRDDLPVWAAGSLTIGAGRPDLVFASYRPHVVSLAHVDRVCIAILAYLRIVQCANIETISNRLGRSQKILSRNLDSLIEIGAVSRDVRKFSLQPDWRNVLPSITTIEVKVADWKRAVAQAARNRIFAHRSLIAVPNHVAQRIRSEPIFTQLGVGLLAVCEDNTLHILKYGPHHQPRVWAYYYEIAALAAGHFLGE